MTPQQAAELAKLRADTPIAWLLIYECGGSAILRDNTRSNNQAIDSHAIRIPLAPVLPATSAGETAGG